MATHLPLPSTPTHKTITVPSTSNLLVDAWLAFTYQTNNVASLSHATPATATVSIVYEAGRVGAARQEEWWGHGGRAPVSSRVGGKRRRPEGGMDKENQPKERKKN